MFTGIIEEIGTVTAVRRASRGASLTISASKILEDVHEGDSIAVNGICLTVTSYTDCSFTVDAVPETLARTSLSMARAGSPVNLERALQAGSRFGGHIVSGHIDGTGTIMKKETDGNAVNVTISFEPSQMKYILEKGSVAVDGVSLTVTRRDRESFSVSIIPHTGAKTILLGKHSGDPVNIECDLVGKYVEQLLQPERGGLTMETLKKYNLGGHYGI